MMATSITATLVLLLVTAVLMTNAYPLTENCTQECQAYKDAEAATSPVYFNVNAKLIDFLNTPDLY